MMKPNEQEEKIFSWVAKNPRKPKRKNAKLDTIEALAEEFIRQYGLDELHKTMMDGDECIDLRWCVQKLLQLYNELDSKGAATKLEIIREFRELNRIAASLHPEMSDSPKRHQRPLEEVGDPFLRMAIGE